MAYMEVPGGGGLAGKGDMRVGALPPRGSEKRRLWCVKTVARRGAARLQLGDLEGARDDFRTALRLRPGDGGLEKDLAEVEKRLGVHEGQENGGHPQFVPAD